MVDLSEVGAFPSVAPGGIQIRVESYLPGIRPTDGFEPPLERRPNLLADRTPTAPSKR
jgi:hypothetical protein